MIILLYIYTYVYSSCHLIVGVFARNMHSTTEFAMTAPSKCVTMPRVTKLRVKELCVCEGVVCERAVCERVVCDRVV